MRILALMLAMMFLTGQAADPAPALRMGLWEATSVAVPMAATGAPAMKMKQGRERMGSPITTRWRMCHSAESWAGALNGLTAEGSGCTVRKREVTERGFVISASCKTAQGKLTFDYKGVYDSLEAMHSSTTSSVEYAESAGGGSIVMNDTTKQKFISPECGTLQPGRKVEVP